jgi:beta-galactosidase
LFDKYPSLLGGAIWEWQDQGIYNNRNPKHPIIAYGGGFGEYPNDHYFIHKGVVFSNRSPKPHYPELKHAYQWVSIRAKDLENGLITVRNRYQFINLDDLTAKWAISENGVTVSSGSFETGTIDPGMEKEIKLPYKLSMQPGSEYFLRVSFDLATDKLWAKKGFEVAAQQLAFPVMIKDNERQLQSGELKFSDSKDRVTVNGPGFSLEFDKTKGTFSKIEKKGKNILMENGGPVLHLWRAPHQQDDMWAYEGWEKYGLKTISWVVNDIQSTQLSPDEVQIKASLTGTGKQNFVVHHEVIYTISGNGTIKAVNKVDFSDRKVVLARLGVRLLLDKDFNQFDYLGRGPMENYADRKQGFDVGHYSSSVAQQLTPYEKPMEAGNHEDVRWAQLKTEKGLGIKLKRDTDLLQVSALPYSDEEMEHVEYRIDLPKSKSTVLCISHKTLGVGSNGCGPRPLDPYKVFAEPTTFSYLIQLL